MLKKRWFCFLLMVMTVLTASCLGLGHVQEDGVIITLSIASKSSSYLSGFDM